MRFTLRFLPRNAAAYALLYIPSPRHACRLFAGRARARDPGIVVANMDRSVKPGDDFHHYANGDWIKRTELLPTRCDIDVYSSLDDLSAKRIAGLIEEAAKANAPVGSNTRKIADLYHSFMDEATIEVKGLARSASADWSSGEAAVTSVSNPTTDAVTVRYSITYRPSHR